jgi:altronate dehydratase
MTKYGKLIDQSDNVITVVADCNAGDPVTVKFQGQEFTYRCNEDVPYGHKVARAEIKEGENVIKYGEAIGRASQDIAAGDWVHTHNVRDVYKCLDRNGNPLPGQEDNPACQPPSVAG